MTDSPRSQSPPAVPFSFSPATTPPFGTWFYPGETSSSEFDSASLSSDTLSNVSELDIGSPLVPVADDWAESPCLVSPEPDSPPALDDDAVGLPFWPTEDEVAEAVRLHGGDLEPVAAPEETAAPVRTGQECLRNAQLQPTAQQADIEAPPVLDAVWGHVEYPEPGPPTVYASDWALANWGAFMHELTPVGLVWAVLHISLPPLRAAWTVPDLSLFDGRLCWHYVGGVSRAWWDLVLFEAFYLVIFWTERDASSACRDSRSIDHRPEPMPPTTRTAAARAAAAVLPLALRPDDGSKNIPSWTPVKQPNPPANSDKRPRTSPEAEDQPAAKRSRQPDRRAIHSVLLPLGDQPEPEAYSQRHGKTLITYHHAPVERPDVEWSLATLRRFITDYFHLNWEIERIVPIELRDQETWRYAMWSTGICRNLFASIDVRQREHPQVNQDEDGDFVMADADRDKSDNGSHRNTDDESATMNVVPEITAVIQRSRPAKKTRHHSVTLVPPGASRIRERRSPRPRAPTHTEMARIMTALGHYLEDGMTDGYNWNHQCNHCTTVTLDRLSTSRAFTSARTNPALGIAAKFAAFTVRRGSRRPTRTRTVMGTTDSESRDNSPTRSGADHLRTRADYVLDAGDEEEPEMLYAEHFRRGKKRFGRQRGGRQEACENTDYDYGDGCTLARRPPVAFRDVVEVAKRMDREAAAVSPPHGRPTASEPRHQNRRIPRLHRAAHLSPGKEYEYLPDFSTGHIPVVVLRCRRLSLPSFAGPYPVRACEAWEGCQQLSPESPTAMWHLTTG
ncbi:hypothetical protein EDC01DRAFT_782343 [Geopyxis carbonaria]|nr:hypothetical protein EDC01DRAFT_782343 [Geopyxis carbonaria]